MTELDLNADIGEGKADDAALLALVTSASIACGGHAGNEHTMREAVCAARDRGVAIGAHPGFLDPEHFGRRRLPLPLEAVTAQVLEQVDALQTIARAEGAEIRYVKLHGALANMASEDDSLAHGIFAAIGLHHPELALLTLAGSAQERAARHLGTNAVAEAYADRAYTPEGLLVARTEPGSVIDDAGTVAERCARLAERGEIVTIDGSILRTNARSICLHGDTAGALELASAVRTRLARSITVSSAFL